jgi:hypothetical protein
MPRNANSDSIIPKPDWAAFGLCLFGLESYQRIQADSLMYRDIERIKNFIGEAKSDLENLKTIWDSSILGCPIQSRPSCLEAQVWTEIAIACAMPFEFDNEGHLLLKE